MQQPLVRHPRLALTILVLISVLVAIDLLFLVDRFVGASGFVLPVGLVLPPHHSVTYKTPEFGFEAATNTLGFRDREFSSARTSTSRIVALGDSFTFGWGVAVEETWPKVLEASLRAQGLSVEIANLGLPGADPDDYATIAVRAIPSLRPDVVIVAVLQGDDLAQMAQYDSTNCAPHQALSWRARLLNLYPNLAQLIAPKQAPGGLGSAVTSEWQREVEATLTHATESDRRRFNAMNPRVQQAFRRGELNPAILASSLKSPTYFMTTMLPDPGREALVDDMAACLAKIRAIGEANGAQVIAVAVPFGAYVNKRGLETRRWLGFRLDESVLVSNEMDAAIRLAANAAGIPFFTVTGQFRASAPNPPLYFELDGHFTPRGHRLFADSIAPAVRNVLKKARGAAQPLPPSK